MTLIDRINRFLSVHLDVLKQIMAVSVWWPLTVILALNLCVLYALNHVTSPLFMEPVMLWVEFLDAVFGTHNADTFGRYPFHLYMLPDVFGWAKFVVSFFFEGLVLGYVAIKFAPKFEGVSQDRPTNQSVLKLWPRLFLAWLVVNVLMVAAGFLVPVLLEGFLGSPKRLFVFNALLMPSVFVFILSLFLFAIPAVATKGDSVLRALSRSLGIFVRNPFTCLFLAGLVLALPLFFSVLTGYSVRIVQDFKPSLIVIFLSVGIVSDFLGNFIWIGSTVRLLNDRNEL